MPLIECPDCRTKVSDKASACPRCGYPIAASGDYDPVAAKRAQRLLNDPQSGDEPDKSKGSGFVGFAIRASLLVIGIAIVYSVATSKDGTTTTAEKVIPSCKTVWHLCADNADMINNFTDISRGQYSCKTEAEKLAKYGSPKWPWFAFSTFHKGSDYVQTGVAILIEKDAQFQNGFGAMAHSTVTCRYDLKSDTVLDVVVGQN